MYIKEEYLPQIRLDDEIIYLNHAAVSPWPLATCEAVKQFAEENLHLGSKNYPQWMATEQQLRGQMAAMINAGSADDIALLKNTSEALSVVAHGIAWQRGDNVVSSNEEFPSNRIVWESLQEQGVELRCADLKTGHSPEEALFTMVDEHTRMIAISSVEYASGLRMDLKRIGEFCQQHNILFCVDAIQSIGAMQFDVQACHIDFAMADGHKWMMGPEGLALFYVRPQLREQLALHQFGWHMTEDYLNFDALEWKAAGTARRFECGSPNMLAIHALSASLQFLLNIGMETIERQVLEHTHYLLEEINRHPQLEAVTSTDTERLAGIVTFKRRGMESQGLYTQLMQNNIACACRGGGVRYSPHFYLDSSALEQALQQAIKLQ